MGHVVVTTLNAAPFGKSFDKTVCGGDSVVPNCYSSFDLHGETPVQRYGKGKENEVSGSLMVWLILTF